MEESESVTHRDGLFHLQFRFLLLLSASVALTELKVPVSGLEVFIQIISLKPLTSPKESVNYYSFIVHQAQRM